MEFTVTQAVLIGMFMSSGILYFLTGFACHIHFLVSKWHEGKAEKEIIQQLMQHGAVVVHQHSSATKKKMDA